MRLLHFVQDHITCRGVRIGALVSAAALAALGIIAEVDGRFGLSGITEMKVVAGQEQFLCISLCIVCSYPKITNKGITPKAGGND